MSIPIYLAATVLAAGMYMNRSGKQPRDTEHQRQTIPEDEKPSAKNTYHSEQVYNAWAQDFDKSARSHIQALDPINENRIPRFANEMATRSDMSPEMQSYLEKRGQRTLYYKEEVQGRENFINEGGKEQTIDSSPMFNPLGNAHDTQNALTDDERQQRIEPFTVDNRKSNGQTTKQEHFGMFTIHGPRNSNNPNYHNNMVPYFGSHIYQNTDPQAHQHLMERFTGQTNSETELRSQPKREIPSLQDRTPGQTFIYGTPSENSNIRDRYHTSTLKTNITPVEQVRVGPGVSGTFDSTPRDGFHPWYRPPTRNVDELRVNPKNTYEGRLLPGEEIVKNRGFIGQVNKYHPDTFYVNDPRRWFKTTGAYTAPTIRENFNANKQNREDSNVSYSGIAGSGGTVGPRPGVHLEGSIASQGVLSKQGACSPMAPIAALNSQVSHTDKNQLPSTGPYRNVRGDSQRNQKYLYDEAKATIKETTYVEGYTGIVGNEGQLRNQKYLYDQAKPTTKETTYVMDYTGIVGNEALQRNQQYTYDQAKPTTKETTHVEGYTGIIGNEGQLRNQKYLYDQARPTTKETTHVMDYTGIIGNETLQRNQQYNYDDAKPTIRETTHVMDYTGIIGNEGQLRNQKYLYDDAKPTIRQTTHVEGYTGIIGNEGQIRNQKYLYDQAKPTTKETTHIMDYTGIAGSEGNLRNQKYLYDKARATTKQTTLVEGYQGIIGNGENTMPLSYESMYNATNNNNMEGLLQGRTFGPNKSTNINIGACDVNMQIKQRTGYDITRWGPNENRLYTAIPNIGDNFQNTTTQNQRDQPGVRQPEDFVVSQFQTNPYSQSLNSAPRVTSPWVRGEVPFQNC